MLRELLWRITYRCDKNCSFCFNNVFDDKVNYFALEAREIEPILNFVRKYKIGKVYLSGGEPAVCDQLPSVIQQLAPLSRVTVFTNGLLLNRYLVKELFTMPVSAINISVDLGDLLQTSPWFEQLLQKITELKTMGVAYQINVQLMIDSYFWQVLDSRNFLRLRKTVDRIFWQPLTVPYGHALYNQTLEGMPPEEGKKILAEVANSDNQEMRAHVEYIRKILAGETTVDCQMGCTYITVNPDFSVSICPHCNGIVIPMDQFRPTTTRQRCGQCSMRCICLYSHLERRYSQS